MQARPGASGSRSKFLPSVASQPLQTALTSPALLAQCFPLPPLRPPIWVLLERLSGSLEAGNRLGPDWNALDP